MPTDANGGDYSGLLIPDQVGGYSTQYIARPTPNAQWPTPNAQWPAPDADGLMSEPDAWIRWLNPMAGA